MASRKIPIATVYNGVDIRFWTRPGIKKEPDIPIIVTVGRLEYVKGHDVLIQAFVRVHEQFPEAQLLIIGDGSKRASLEELAKTVGLNRHVSFLGTLDRIAIRNQLHDASIFAMPSRSEGFGLAALEAMATGLPVIGSRVGGLPEVVGEEAGILVEPEDPEALAGAMLHMFETPGLLAQMSEAAIKRASLFSWENAVDSYLSVFAGTRTREGEFLEAPYAMARGEIIPEQ